MNTTVKILIFLALSIHVMEVPAQDISGIWNGKLDVGMISLRIVFHIHQTADGYSATMDSPDQGMKGLAAGSTGFDNNTLTLSFPTIGAGYEGTRSHSGDTLKGAFTQGGQRFPLDLARGGMAETNRPQHPVKPYPYVEREVKFENPEANVTLAGTLTLPDEKGKYPAVVLISGSGAQNRDEELMGHKPFLVLADFLTRNGIAVLRYDDRGTHASTGVFATATTADFASDARSAFRFLARQKNIDPAQIGLAGHSEGAIAAAVVASENKDVDFIVMMAGPGIRGDSLLILQSTALLQASGADAYATGFATTLNRKIYDVILQDTDSEQKEKEIRHLLTEHMGKEQIEAQLKTVLSPWTQYFIRFNPATCLEKVQCPVLAMIGSKDLQVPPDENLSAIQKALAGGGNNKFTMKKPEGLNHLFQECTTGLPTEYGGIEQTFSPVALNMILEFIQSLK